MARMYTPRFDPITAPKAGRILVVDEDEVLFQDLSVVTAARDY